MHTVYRYVIDLDGDGCSGRLGKLLTSGAVVLKPWAAGYPFYYRALHKWEHYVPLRPDLSDLPERVRWLQAHDAEAEAIGRRAAAFARFLGVDKVGFFRSGDNATDCLTRVKPWLARLRAYAASDARPADGGFDANACSSDLYRGRLTLLESGQCLCYRSWSGRWTLLEPGTISSSGPWSGPRLPLRS